MKCRIRSSALTILLVTLGIGAAGGAEAQSVLATRGLGFPLEPTEGRGAGLGGLGLGLPEPEISWANPAAAINLFAPGLVISYQYDNVTAQGVEGVPEGSTARFPLLLAAFPAGERFVIQAGYGSFLDQNWLVERPDTLVLGGDTVPIVDRFASEGGVARLRLGGAYEVLENVGVGVAVDLYTGAVERVQGRLFPGEVEPGCCRVGWTYRGLGYTLGAQWSPAGSSGVAASLTHGGRLEATTADPLADEASYDLPLVARAGASGRIGQTLLAAVGGSWAGWSRLDEALAQQGGARDSWTVQGGLEWDGLLLRERPVPLRIGGRTGALPFRWDHGPGDFLNERALTVGGGVVLAGGATRTDLALEFGDRGGDTAGVEESYWRLALSVKVLGR
jgi:hypothetical protein